MEPSKREVSTQCCFTIDPPLTALDQHKNNIGSSLHVCWESCPHYDTRVPSVSGWNRLNTVLCVHPRVKVSIVWSLRDREVACSASDRQGSNFESCVWRTVSSQSSHQPQEVLLAQFSLYVHKGGLKPDSFHFLYRPKSSAICIYRTATHMFN